ncbi:MAG: N-formylglutamate amidohydrolase, partial [Pseudomonadota bacterium]
MPKAAYKVSYPDRQASCVVFASPHSGRDYPGAFLRQSVLDSHTIRSSEDAFVDLLFAAAPEFGAPLLTAGAPRAYVDLNRSCD